jgi:CheY-like chemotaxis protein
VKILTSNNAAIFRQLGSKSFRVANIEHQAAGTAKELSEKARTFRPQLVILDSHLADGTGFDLCKQLKTDPELPGIRVMIVLDNSLDQWQLSLCQASLCDDILCLPAPTEELYSHVAGFLGLPVRDSRRVQVHIQAEVDTGKSRVTGTVVDLSESGARLRVPGQLPPGKVTVRLSRATTGAEKELGAQIVWQRDDSKKGGFEVGLKFSDLDIEALSRLKSCCLWELRPSDGGGCLVTLHGDFAESVDFKLLLEGLAPYSEVELDLFNVHRVNSIGQMRWNEFARALDDKKVSFLRCSVEFITHAAMTSGMLGKGRVESLVAPYMCASCGANELRLLQMAAVLADKHKPTPPSMRCPTCGGELEFDDIPERYFSFLD